MLTLHDYMYKILASYLMSMYIQTDETFYKRYDAIEQLEIKSRSQ